jgi:Leucine-rich repeat (LRR) protein
MVVQICFGRELSCSYWTISKTLWPEHSYCFVQNVDFSDNFRSEPHSFSGWPYEKFEIKAFHIYTSPQVDFIPIQIFDEFENLNGLYLYQSNLPTKLNPGFFTIYFNRIEYLGIQKCNLQSIGQNTFEHLNKLKWLCLRENEIKSLSELIFKNSPNLLYIDFSSNKINAVNPVLFRNLTNLKYIEAEGNQCIKKNLGCETCSLSQSDLDSEFSSCFYNCIYFHAHCAVMTAQIENPTPAEIRDHVDALHDQRSKIALEKNNGLNRNSQESQMNSSSESEYQNLNEKVTNVSNRLSSQQDGLSSLSRTVENFGKTVESLSEKFSELKLLMEMERMQFKLKEAEHVNEKQAVELQINRMKQEFSKKLELQAKEFESRESVLKKEIDEIVNQKLEAFMTKLREDSPA